MTSEVETGTVTDGDGQDEIPTYDLSSEKLIRLGEVQLLLRQMKISSVREDFSDGKILKTQAGDRETLLLSFDALYDVFHPKWDVDPRTRFNSVQVMNKHLDKICTESTEKFDIPNSYTNLDMFTYRQWNRALHDLYCSSYWQKVSLKKPKDEDNREDSIFMRSADVERPRASRYKLRSQGRTSSPQSSSSRRRQTRTSVELIEIEDSSENTDSDDSSSDDCSVDRYRRRGLYPKAVVEPECFEVGGRSSMKTFLKDFERYFRTKFQGNQRDCCRELCRFLDGEAKEAYEALGGSRLKYPEMKDELLRWYKTLRMGKTSSVKEELRQMYMKTGESFKLYCMRLQETAKRAYPHDEKECAKQLKKKLLSSTPKWFAECIEKREEIMRVARGLKMTWRDMVDVAEDEDKRIKKKKKTAETNSEIQTAPESFRCDIVEATVPNVKNQAAVSGLPPRQPEKPEPYVQQRSFGRGGRMAGGRRQCHYCGRRGHEQRECRIRSGECFRCGVRGHSYITCNKPPRQFEAQCPICQGKHLGVDCPNKSGYNNSETERNEKRESGQRSTAEYGGARPRELPPAAAACENPRFESALATKESFNSHQVKDTWGIEKGKGFDWGDDMNRGPTENF